MQVSWIHSLQGKKHNFYTIIHHHNNYQYTTTPPPLSGNEMSTTEDPGRKRESQETILSEEGQLVLWRW